MAQDILSNGFVRLCIDPSLNFYDGACRVLLIGQGLDTGTNDFIPNTIQQVNNVRDLGDMFGRGSVLSEALRRVLCQCPNNVQLFAVGLEDPNEAGDVAAVYTTTITGPATSDGRFTLFLGEGDYNVDVIVREGDTVATIAARVVAAVSPDFPYIPAAIATGITWTARNKGEIGNFLNPIYNWSGRRNYAPGGVTVTTAVTTVGVGVPVMPDLIDLAGECCYSCVGYLGGDTDNQDILEAYLNDAWDCSKPQCFGHGYVFNSGTLGQVLATGDNAAVLSRMAYALNSYDLPYLTLAAFIAKSCCTACTNPELSIQGPENGRLDCISIPQSCASPWTFDERTQLQEAGFVTYGPSGFGTGAMTNPQIFNDVTNYLVDELGRENVTFRDASSRRLAAATALSVAEKLNAYNGLALFTKNTKINQGIKGTNPRLILADLRAWAKANIGILFSEFDNIDQDIQVKTDFEVADACRGNPNWLWVFLQYLPPNRIGRINTNLVPKVLSNCNR